jgi:hypothetical protein
MVDVARAQECSTQDDCRKFTVIPFHSSESVPQMYLPASGHFQERLEEEIVSASRRNQHAGVCYPKFAAFLSDGNDPPPLRYGAASSSGFGGRRLGLVGDQLAQERNQHGEATTILARACART